MQYTSSFDEATHTCNIKVTGFFKRPENTIELQIFARSLFQEKGITRFLVDMRDAEIHSSPVDDFEAGIMPGDHDHALHSLRFAAVYSGDLGKQIFMETVAINRGYQVRVFDDMDKARDWILEDKN